MNNIKFLSISEYSGIFVKGVKVLMKRIIFIIRRLVLINISYYKKKWLEYYIEEIINYFLWIIKLFWMTHSIWRKFGLSTVTVGPNAWLSIENFINRSLICRKLFIKKGNTKSFLLSAPLGFLKRRNFTNRYFINNCITKLLEGMLDICCQIHSVLLKWENRKTLKIYKKCANYFLRFPMGVTFFDVI